MMDKSLVRGKVTPDEYLRALGGFNIRRGHKLPLLSTFGYEPFFTFQAAKALADLYGYALSVPYALSKDFDQRLVDPNDINYAPVRLAVDHPDLYQLKVMLDNTYQTNLEGYYMHDAQGNRLKDFDGSYSQKMNPEADQSFFDYAVDKARPGLAFVSAVAPIATIHNHAEVGVSVLKDHPDIEYADPLVLAAKGLKSWYQYISERRLHQELPLMNLVRELVPDRQAYLNYAVAGNFKRGGSFNWDKFDHDYTLLKQATDYASGSTYYGQFNSGWINPGGFDMLTEALNCIAFQILLGEPYSYNFVSGGWIGTDNDLGLCPDLNIYEGFLKCYYMAGNISSVEGYFVPDSHDNTPFDFNNPPHWLRQLVSVSRVHCLFTHLDDYIFNGDLLEGDGRHMWSTDLPSYEFHVYSAQTSSIVQGRLNKDLCRVVVRKMKTVNKWILTAWSPDGQERDISFKLPIYGWVNVTSKGVGVVYKIDGLGYLPQEFQA